MLVQAASEVQRNMRMVSRPGAVEAEEAARFRARGYRSVDETQVVRIETNKYFSFLMNMITGAGEGHHATFLSFSAQFIISRLNLVKSAIFQK